VLSVANCLGILAIAVGVRTSPVGEFLRTKPSLPYPEEGFSGIPSHENSVDCEIDRYEYRYSRREMEKHTEVCQNLAMNPCRSLTRRMSGLPSTYSTRKMCPFRRRNLEDWASR